MSKWSEFYKYLVMLRYCSNSINILTFTSACIAVPYSRAYIIYKMFLHKHGIEESVGDWNCPLLSTFLYNKS